MRKLILLVSLLCSPTLFSQAALAASSPWAVGTGVRVRLVTTGVPDEKGLIKGALDIDLASGWKTYWRDPGDAGVPPQIDFSGSRNLSVVDVAYPAPHRFSDAGGIWAGYKKPVRFGLVLKAADPSKPMELDAKIFIGVCQSICVPFQAQLSLDPAKDTDDLMDAAVVADTFAALPATPTKQFNAVETRKTPTALAISAALPQPDTAAELFVAAPEGYSFGAPKQLESKNGKAIFSVPVLGGNDVDRGSVKIPYTLVQGSQAVAGEL
ncbi:MAG TPA: protein-disulfide reductase DsbD domain-containing protein [Rhizobiaceae bacterium]|nr:protein-disulfide reductase DsbD domain-containing protein [Rhizobiaceae bacterium]